ncbi:MAG: hypothetical protein K2K04_03810, partial [Clostridia bacterium]|nr:hypothetical protein [Clostridia bacterium]
MKKFKRVLICAAACATAFSFTALTACTENGPADGLSSDVKVTTALSASRLNAQIAKFENGSATSLNVSGGLNITKVGGQAVEMAVATVSAKANLDVGNADIALAINSLLLGNGE